MEWIWNIPILTFVKNVAWDTRYSTYALWCVVDFRGLHNYFASLFYTSDRVHWYYSVLSYLLFESESKVVHKSPLLVLLSSSAPAPSIWPWPPYPYTALITIQSLLIFSCTGILVVVCLFQKGSVYIFPQIYTCSRTHQMATKIIFKPWPLFNYVKIIVNGEQNSKGGSLILVNILMFYTLFCTVYNDTFNIYNHAIFQCQWVAAPCPCSIYE